MIRCSVSFAVIFSMAATACTPSAAAETPAAKKKYALAVMTEPQTIAKATPAKYKITITPAEGFVLKTATPFTAKLASATGCKLAKTQFNNQEFDDPKAAAKSVSTTFTAEKPGQNEITADLTFFICNEELCERFKEKPQLTFAVK